MRCFGRISHGFRKLLGIWFLTGNWTFFFTSDIISDWPFFWRNMESGWEGWMEVEPKGEKWIFQDDEIDAWTHGIL